MLFVLVNNIITTSKEQRQRKWKSGVCQCQRLNCMLISMDPSDSLHSCIYLILITPSFLYYINFIIIQIYIYKYICFIHRELAKALTENQKGAVNISQVEHVIMKRMLCVSLFYSPV